MRLSRSFFTRAPWHVAALAALAALPLCVASTAQAGWRLDGEGPWACRPWLAATGGTIYAVGSDDGVFDGLDHVWAYDSAANRWSQRAPVADARYGSTGAAAAAGADGKVYVVGGVDVSGAAVAQTSVYQPAGDSWSVAAPLPTPRDAARAALGSDGRIYVVGGRTWDSGTGRWVASATVEAYDPATDRWAAVAPLPVALSDVAVAAGPRGRIYAIGGSDGTSATARAWVFAPRRNAWQELPPLPQPASGATASLGADGSVYLLGAGSSGVLRYAPSTRTWSRAPQLAEAVQGGALVSGPGGHLYAIAGRSAGSDACSGLTQEYLPGDAGAFADGFESGDLAAWTNAGLSVRAGSVHAGSFAARSVGPASSALRPLSSAQDDVYARAFVRVDAADANPVALLSLRRHQLSGFRVVDSGPKALASLTRAADGTLSLQVLPAGTAYQARVYHSTATLPLGSWHELQLRLVSRDGAGRSQVWLDGRRIADLAQRFPMAYLSEYLQLGDDAPDAQRRWDVSFDDVQVAGRAG